METVEGSKGPSSTGPMMAGAHQGPPQSTNGASTMNSASNSRQNRYLSHSAPPSFVSPSPTRDNLPNPTETPSTPLQVENPTRSQDIDDISLISNEGDEVHGIIDITQCKNYSEYAKWLKQHFSAVMNDVAVHFVHDFLLIRSRSELELYMGYKPGDFLRKLGYRLYKDKLDLLME